MASNTALGVAAEVLRLLLLVTHFTLVAICATWEAVASGVVDVARWEHPARTKFIANCTMHLPATRDALPGVLVEGPGFFLDVANFAGVAVRATREQISRRITGVMDVALWELVIRLFLSTS